MCQESKKKLSCQSVCKAVLDGRTLSSCLSPHLGPNRALLMWRGAEVRSDQIPPHVSCKGQG